MKLNIAWPAQTSPAIGTPRDAPPEPMRPHLERALDRGVPEAVEVLDRGARIGRRGHPYWYVTYRAASGIACRPGEELFANSLAGGGRSGILAEITLRTIRRPPQITGRVITWPTLDAFVFDRATLRAYEYVRARAYFAPDGAQRVVGLVGAFGVELPMPDPMFSLVGSDASQTDTIDLASLAEVDPTMTWPQFAPCLELTFSIPNGLAIWSRLHAALHAHRLLRHLPDGASVMVVAGDPGFPHAPLGAGDNLLVALRPGFADEATARAVGSELDALGADAIRDGARLYPVG